MPVWTLIAIVAATIVVGAPLMGWLVARSPRHRKGFAVASALFFSFGIFNPGQERIVEAREDEEYGKRQKADDPPEP